MVSAAGWPDRRRGTGKGGGDKGQRPVTGGLPVGRIVGTQSRDVRATVACLVDATEMRGLSFLYTVGCSLEIAALAQRVGQGSGHGAIVDVHIRGSVRAGQQLGQRDFRGNLQAVDGISFHIGFPDRRAVNILTTYDQ